MTQNLKSKLSRWQEQGIGMGLLEVSGDTDGGKVDIGGTIGAVTSYV